MMLRRRGSPSPWGHQRCRIPNQLPVDHFRLRGLALCAGTSKACPIAHAFNPLHTLSTHGNC